MKTLAICLAAGLAAHGLLADTPAAARPQPGTTREMGEIYWKAWDKEQARIDADIEKYRKADFTVSGFEPGQSIQVEQLTHQFLFGGNTFLFDHQDTEAKREAYKDLWRKLLNAATVAIYWRDLEPERGQFRWGPDSPYIYRRPPVDPVLDFCASNNINVNAHALIYGQGFAVPKWWNEKYPVKAREQDIFEHIALVGRHIGNRVQRWDIVNESLHQHLRRLMPPDYLFQAFDWAKAMLPEEADFGTNEGDLQWGVSNDMKIIARIIRNLIARGAKVDHVGLQCHIYEERFFPPIVKGTARGLYPNSMRKTLDFLAAIGKPIHLSELTLCAPTEDEKGFAQQAELVRNFYRMLFSHPAVEAITWWNCVDCGGYGNESKYSGLLTKDYQPKPAWFVLDNLINKEWKTRTTVTADPQGNIHFRGFRGTYRFTAPDGKTTTQACR
ncbi:MAG: endo-1,4-beta-xylanase [Kiritimatiellia bacterium]